MRVVIDTNIAFSAILNTNSKISQIILHPKSNLNLYSTEHLEFELLNHWDKLKKISKYSDIELHKTSTLIISRIRLIKVEFIPREIFIKSEELTKNIDIDDTEFVALTEHIKGKLWTGDKELTSGLKKRNWNRIVSTDELYKRIVTRL